jgi:TolB-like protein/DNA-binding winged helix-turn-helix (wHTH) protein/tetratricopeptide (TPR) repeat protein
MSGPVVRFGAFELDRSTGELRCQGRRVPLQDQPAQLLALLVSRPGEVVTREELRRALWSDDTFVDFDTALNVAVNKVRQALRDSATSPRFVETLPKRGYRFLADVKPAGEATTPAEGTTAVTQAMPTTSASRRWIALSVIAAALVVVALVLTTPWERKAATPRSLAVLPFRPLASDARDEALEVGMAEAVIVKLGRHATLRVPSIAAVQRYAGRAPDPLQAGRELGVDAVLDGSLQRADGRLRVSARLLDVRTGASRWARQWDLPWTDVFTVQDAMASEVAHELAVTLAPSQGPRHTTHPDAYDRYLRARYLVNQRTMKTSLRAAELLEEAVKIDPGFAPAYTVMADAYLAIPWLGATREPHLGKARLAVQRAIELDPGDAAAHTTLGTIQAQFDWDPVAGERELKRGLELGPDVPTVMRYYAIFLWHEGRFDEALALNDRELALDPTSPFANRNRAMILYYARRYDDCVSQARKAVELDRHFVTTYGWLGRAYEQLGREREAIEAYVQPFTFEGRSNDAASLRAAGAAGGMRAFWKRWLEIEERQPQYDHTDVPALAWMQMGERQRALEELVKLGEARCPWARAIGVEPQFDPLRGDPRFQALLRKVGLVRS